MKKVLVFITILPWILLIVGIVIYQTEGVPVSILTLLWMLLSPAWFLIGLVAFAEFVKRKEEK